MELAIEGAAQFEAAKLKRGLPLSCLLHLAGILLLAFWLAHAPAAPEEVPVAEVVMELPPEPQSVDESQQAMDPDGQPAAENAMIAEAATGRSAEAAAPLPLLQAMASSLAGTSDDGAAQTTMLPAPDSVTDQEKTKVPQRPASSAEQPEAAAVPVSQAADGIPAAASGHHTGEGAASATGGAADASTGAGGNGTAEGAGGSGSASGSSGSTESSADIAARFAARVEANKEYPYSAIQRQQQGAVTTSVTLAADGSLLSADVVSSSGIGSLDRSALAAVRAAWPKPLAKNSACAPCPWRSGHPHALTPEWLTRLDAARPHRGAQDLLAARQYFRELCRRLSREGA